MSKSRLILFLFFVAIISFLFYKNTGKSICLFYNIYGIACPTCGMTRAYKNLLELNFKQAFIFHPLFWLVPFLILFYKAKKYLYVIFGIFIFIWLLRLFLYFPNKNNEVFNFNKNALFPKIYREIIIK